MANRPAVALGLREGDREELSRLTRASSVRAGRAQRARIVLLAADGESNTAIAVKVGVSRPTVIDWRNRYAAQGISGLDDDPRSGRPRTIDHRDIVAATLKPPPKKYGVTHWSSRLLGRHLGISNGTVAKAWRDYGVAPWRVETFKFSTDPELVGKVIDVVGLYLAPPENAIVLCIDELGRAEARCSRSPSRVRSICAAASATFLQTLRFLSPPSEPDVRVSTHPALHEPMPRGYATDPSAFLAHGVAMLSARYR